MFTAEHYLLAESIQQAYELNQSKRNAILGGLFWLRMGNKKIHTLIDLSNLGFNQIEETQQEFIIGSMCTLRDFELHEGLNTFFQQAPFKSVEHIVGTQFRNTATMGGSVYSRFGFSDILTLLLCLNASVQLYQKGMLSLEEYIQKSYDRDILMKIQIPKQTCQVRYLTQRLSATDFPVLTCAVARFETGWRIVLGARPQKATLVRYDLPQFPTQQDISGLLEFVQKQVVFGDNMRGSAAYRTHLAAVLIERAIGSILEDGHAD